MLVSDTIAEWVCGPQIKNVPGDVLQKAKESIVDTCGAMLAACNLEVVRILRSYILERNAGADCCTIIGSPDKTSAPLAGLVNAAAAHALDIDDTNYSGISHPSAAVFPTVIACGEKVNASGSEVLESFIIGYEVGCKLGSALNPNLYQKGWFTTSLLGTIGSAAAAARLLKLEKKQIKSAIGLSVCQASGIRRNNGTMAKPYSLGRAVENGILSAILARNGITASDEIFEGEDGFISVFNDSLYNDGAFSCLGKEFELIEPGSVFKQYPTCSGSHSAMQAVKVIIGQEKLDPDEILEIICQVTPLVKKSLKYDNPQTIEQAQFSMPFCIASVLLNGDLGVAGLTNRLFLEPKYKKVMKIVRMEVDDEITQKSKRDSAPEAAQVKIKLTNGRLIMKYVGNSKGTKINPLAKDELEEKFINNAKDILGFEKIIKCLDNLWQLEKIGNINMLTMNLTGEN